MSRVVAGLCGRGWRRRVGKGSGKGGVETGVEEGEERGKGDGQNGEEKRGKGASASAFLAFFYLCLRRGGFKSGAFLFFSI